MRTDHRHVNMLKQKIGAREAREFWFRCELTYPCDHCGADRSEQCRTASGLAVPYTHRARSAAAFDFCHESLWDATNADVEEAEMARQQSPRPRIRLVDVDEFDGIREELRLLRAAILELAGHRERVARLVVLATKLGASEGLLAQAHGDRLEVRRIQDEATEGEGVRS